MIEKEDNRLNKNELDLTISIVNTNNKDMLKSCLKSIMIQQKKQVLKSLLPIIFQQMAVLK